MWLALYQFFNSTVLSGFNIPGRDIPQFTIGGVTLSLRDYLSLIGTIVSIVVIFVLCCLFVYKIIKLIGGLIR